MFRLMETESKNKYKKLEKTLSTNIDNIYVPNNKKQKNASSTVIAKNNDIYVNKNETKIDIIDDFISSTYIEQEKAKTAPPILKTYDVSTEKQIITTNIISETNDKIQKIDHSYNDYTNDDDNDNENKTNDDDYVFFHTDNSLDGNSFFKCFEEDQNINNAVDCEESVDIDNKKILEVASSIYEREPMILQNDDFDPFDRHDTNAYDVDKTKHRKQKNINRLGMVGFSAAVIMGSAWLNNYFST